MLQKLTKFSLRIGHYSTICHLCCLRETQFKELATLNFLAYVLMKT